MFFLWWNDRYAPCARTAFIWQSRNARRYGANGGNDMLCKKATPTRPSSTHTPHNACAAMQSAASKWTVSWSPPTLRNCKALTAYYKHMLGTTSDPVWHFDVSELYHGRVRASDALTTEFTEAEAWSAVRSMNGGSAPGPDGFGPSFYRATWPTVKAQVMQFLASFHQGNVQLERINRSYMVLLPKKPGAAAVDAFRPICL